MGQTDRLVRRTIRDTLKRQYDWEAVSHVDGSVDVFMPTSFTDADAFAEVVTAAVRKLGYEPVIQVYRSGAPERVRLMTPETLEQAPRGAHGAGHGR